MPTDILLLTNAPGEVATWVKPIVHCLRQRVADHDQLRISVMLSPCPHASGGEANSLRSYAEIDRVQEPQYFYRFLLTGRTAADWDWWPQGVVVFLGGDQLYAVWAAKRLGYQTVIYAEWEGRWQAWVDRYGAMQAGVIEKATPQYRQKFTVVGDLMADITATADPAQPVATRLGLDDQTTLIGLLPGSKGAKAKVGVPLVLAIANHLHHHRPEIRFVIPVAPTLDIETLTNYADPSQNPVVTVMDGPPVRLVMPTDSQQLPYLQTESGATVALWTDFPALEMLSRCQLCLTTVGANTAQLGSLAIPMVVLLPTQQLDAMRTWDGLPGILARLPGVGTPISKLINRVMIQVIRRHQKRFAWPNIWAKREVVPELLGNITAEEISTLVIDYLDHPHQLQAMHQSLRELRGPTGAAAKMADLILAPGQCSQ